MKVTMYELLGMIKDGKAPKTIKSEGHYYKYNKLKKDYYEGMGYDYDYLLANTSVKGLDDEIEIIEEKKMCHKCHKYPAEYNQTLCEFCLGISKEEKKIPEKLNVEQDGEGRVDGIYMARQEVEERKTINSIIDYLDYLKSKGDE